LSNSGDTSDGALGSDVLWIEKAESAMAHRRYISPAEDNVIFYCGKVLARDPFNAKAIELKKESLKQATKQAQEFIDKRRYANARELYRALLQLPKKEGLNQADLTLQLKKVEFDSYPVVHDHLIGSCTGTLKINSYALSFAPAGGSRDGFTQPLSRIKILELDDTLRIEVNQKTCRFEAISGKNDRDRKTATRELHELLSSRLQEARL
jgi:hypothetical protein